MSYYQGCKGKTIEKSLIHILGGDWGEEVPDKIPSGWELVKVIRGTEIKNWKILKAKKAEYRIIKKNSLDKRKLEVGDIVLEVSGGSSTFSVGRNILIDEDAITNSDVPLVCSNFYRQLRFESSFEPDFINYFLEYNYKTGAIKQFSKKTTNIQNLEVPRFINQTKIPIMSLEHQKYISSILRKIDEIKKKRVEINQLVSKLTLSIFQNIFSKPIIQNSNVLSVEKLLMNSPQNGLFKKNNLYGKGTKIVWVANITDAILLETSHLKKVQVNSKEIQKYSLQNGDIVVTRSSHLGISGVGIMNVVDELKEDILFESHIMKITPNQEQCNPYYLSTFFASQYGRKLIEQKTKGATMTTINQPELLSIKIPVPPIDLQNKFESKIKKFFPINNKQPILSENINTLYDSVMTSLYNGKIIPK